MESPANPPPRDSDDQEVPLVTLDDGDALYLRWLTQKEWLGDCENDDKALKGGDAT